MTMRRILITIAYDGTDYHGWQIQPGKEESTIEGRLQTALEALLPDGRITLIGASRTDSGVHAEGNAAVFDTDCSIPVKNVPAAINRFLPPDIRVVKAREVPVQFHPRYIPHEKEYIYRVDLGEVADPIRQRFCYHYPYNLAVDKMKLAADCLIGTHDFRSFVNPDSQVFQHGGDAVRTIYGIDLTLSTKRQSFLEIRIRGNGFLYHMIRIIVGTLLQVGTGKTEPEQMETILEAKDRRAAGPTVPAKGLTLMRLNYPEIKGFIFDMDGTLFDTERLYHDLWLKLSEERGFIITEEMMDRMRGAAIQIGASIFESVNPGFKYMEEREIRMERVFEYVDQYGVPKKPGMDATLAWLRAEGYKTAIGSSTLKKQVMRYLQSIGAEALFDFVGTGDMTDHGKPEPDLFLLCAEKMGLKPEECVVVEDSVNGILAGNAAGMQVLAIPDLNDLSAYREKCAALLTSLADIPEWVKKSKS